MSESRPEERMRSGVIVHPAALADQSAVVEPVTPLPETHAQARSDEQLVQLWLHGRSDHTERAYRADWNLFRRLVGKPLHAVILADLQRFADQLEARRLKPVSRHRKLAAIKSLVAFGHRLGYLPFDTARPLRLPALRETLANRILSENEVQQLLAAERHPRNRVILHLFYFSGVRVSELAALRWADLQERGEGGQVTVFGKGGKTRTVLLPLATWLMLISTRGGAGDEQPVIPSRRGGHLHPSQLLRIVQKAARRAGIEKRVSPHWFRHSHASHALDNGAPIHLVQTTLGHGSVATTSRYLHSRPTDSSSNYLGV